MDMVKIGTFLGELRREQNLTQEQLGEKLGVTNKTVSRWETGTYLPPVEMLMLMSELYGVSINEMVSGERLTKEAYVEKAEENLQTALKQAEPWFTVSERTAYFRKKWNKDHRFDIIMMILFCVVLVFLLSAAKYGFLTAFMPAVAAVWLYNQREAYVSEHVYCDKNPLPIEAQKR